MSLPYNHFETPTWFSFFITIFSRERHHCHRNRRGCHCCRWLHCLHCLHCLHYYCHHPVIGCCSSHISVRPVVFHVDVPTSFVPAEGISSAVLMKAIVVVFVVVDVVAATLREARGCCCACCEIACSVFMWYTRFLFKRSVGHFTNCSLQYENDHPLPVTESFSGYLKVLGQNLSVEKFQRFA